MISILKTNEPSFQVFMIMNESFLFSLMTIEKVCMKPDCSIEFRNPPDLLLRSIIPLAEGEKN